jgi:hypothetical protein
MLSYRLFPLNSGMNRMCTMGDIQNPSSSQTFVGTWGRHRRPYTRRNPIQGS